MFHVLSGVFEKVKCHDFALIVLDFAVPANGLDPDSNMHQLPMQTPVISFFGVSDPHRHEVVLPSAQLAKNYHTRPRSIYLRLFFEYLVGRPCIVYPYRWVSGTQVLATASGAIRNDHQRNHGVERYAYLPIQKVITGAL